MFLLIVRLFDYFPWSTPVDGGTPWQRSRDAGIHDIAGRRDRSQIQSLCDTSSKRRQVSDCIEWNRPLAHRVSISRAPVKRNTTISVNIRRTRGSHACQSVGKRVFPENPTVWRPWLRLRRMFTKDLYVGLDAGRGMIQLLSLESAPQLQSWNFIGWLGRNQPT